MTRVEIDRPITVLARAIVNSGLLEQIIDIFLAKKVKALYEAAERAQSFATGDDHGSGSESPKQD